MAIDSVGKRGSAMNVTMPWRRSVPIADGVIDRGDRKYVAYLYYLYDPKFVYPVAAIALGTIIDPITVQRFIHLKKCMLEYALTTAIDVELAAETEVEVEYDAVTRIELEFN